MGATAVGPEDGRGDSNKQDEAEARAKVEEEEKEFAALAQVVDAGLAHDFMEWKKVKGGKSRRSAPYGG